MTPYIPSIDAEPAQAVLNTVAPNFWLACTSYFGDVTIAGKSFWAVGFKGSADIKEFTKTGGTIDEAVDKAVREYRRREIQAELDRPRVAS